MTVADEFKPIQPPPSNIVQATGRVAENIVGGFQGAPTLLLIVILNVIMIITAGYYFIKQDEQRNALAKELVHLIQTCILETTPTPTRTTPF